MSFFYHLLSTLFRGDRAIPTECPPQEETSREPPAILLPLPIPVPASQVDTEDGVDAAGSDEPDAGKTFRVGAWTGSSSLSAPERDVEFARSIGLSRLDIVVNDHSKARNPIPFSLTSEKKTIKLARVATAAGLDVHLMTWIMPHETYIRSAADMLLALAKDTGAKSIQFDAEEPWTQAKKPMGYSNAGALIGELFRGHGIELGVNGIGYAPIDKLGPLAEVCDYVVPQAYSTSSSGQDPATAPKRFGKRWANAFNKPIVMGLAAYRQSGIAGYTEREAVDAALSAARSYGSQGAIYWSLYHMRKNPTVAKTIQDAISGPSDRSIA